MTADHNQLPQRIAEFERDPDSFGPTAVMAFTRDLIAGWREATARADQAVAQAEMVNGERNKAVLALRQSVARVADIRAALAHHLTITGDPCQDRGVEWPCDVANAVEVLTKLVLPAGVGDPAPNPEPPA